MAPTVAMDVLEGTGEVPVTCQSAVDDTAFPQINELNAYPLVELGNTRAMAHNQNNAIHLARLLDKSIEVKLAGGREITGVLKGCVGHRLRRATRRVLRAH